MDFPRSLAALAEIGYDGYLLAELPPDALDGMLWPAIRWNFWQGYWGALATLREAGQGMHNSVCAMIAQTLLLYIVNTVKQTPTNGTSPATRRCSRPDRRRSGRTDWADAPYRFR